MSGVASSGLQAPTGQPIELAHACQTGCVAHEARKHLLLSFRLQILRYSRRLKSSRLCRAACIIRATAT